MFEVIPLITEYYGEIMQDADGEYFMDYSHCQHVKDVMIVRTGMSKGYPTVQKLLKDFGIENIDVIGLN
jgi:hypothetical protein